MWRCAVCGSGGGAGQINANERARSVRERHAYEPRREHSAESEATTSARASRTEGRRLRESRGGGGCETKRQTYQTGLRQLSRPNQRATQRSRRPPAGLCALFVVQGAARYGRSHPHIPLPVQPSINQRGNARNRNVRSTTRRECQKRQPNQARTRHAKNL